MNEIDKAFDKLIDELRRINDDSLSVCLFGSYMTEEFKPWISDVDLLIVYREEWNKGELRTKIEEIFKKHFYLDEKMRFHVRLFDPWIYSEKEITNLPIERVLTYTIPYIKRTYRTLLGENIVQKIPDPSQKEIIESYLKSVLEMYDWLDSHRHLLNGPRLDLTMKAIILRFFNALKGYLTIKGTIETNRKKEVQQFMKLVPHSNSKISREILEVYENWTRNYTKEQVTKYYEGCMNLLKYLYSEAHAK